MAYQPPDDGSDASIADVFHEDVPGVLDRHGPDLACKKYSGRRVLVCVVMD